MKFYIFLIGLLSICFTAVATAQGVPPNDKVSTFASFSAYNSPLDIGQTMDVQRYAPTDQSTPLYVGVTGYANGLFVTVKGLRVDPLQVSEELRILAPDWWTLSEDNEGVLVVPNPNKNPAKVLKVLCNQLRGAYSPFFTYAILKDLTR
jgi:hypothetical protein